MASSKDGGGTLSWRVRGKAACQTLGVGLSGDDGGSSNEARTTENFMVDERIDWLKGARSSWKKNDNLSGCSRDECWMGRYCAE